MAKQTKTPRPKAATPKGFRDYFGTDVTERTEMLRRIAEVYDRYGFDALESAAVETVEALGKFLPDVDRPNAGVFAWQEGEEEGKGDWLALRYDLTAPLARVFAQHRNDLPTPYRRYAMGQVWRNEKPGPGRFRQFYQCDADTVGTASMAADAEICAMLADCMEVVGIPRGDYLIRVNNRKVLNGVLDAMGVTEAAQQADVLRTIDKFDKVGEAGVRELLGKGRLDASGAYIDGVGLSAAQAEPVIAFLTAKKTVLQRLHSEWEASPNDGSQDYKVLAWLLNIEMGAGRQKREQHTEASAKLLAKRTLAYLYEIVGDAEQGRKGVEELAQISDLLTAQGYGPDRIVLDPSVVRGLGYYTGPVFEAELTFEILDEKGRKRQFGSVAGGGRYDDLVARFTGQSVPAVGVSIGVDRLLAALREKNRMGGEAVGPVVVTVMDRDRMVDYQAMVAKLRKAGIRAEVYLGNPKSFGNQLKYADKRNSPAAVIEGADEKARGVVQVKDLVLGKKIAENATLQEWKERPSQAEIPRDDLVAHIKALLAGDK
ncbi:histidine--tRNA ligase [Pseudooceanicola sp.]|uniref:histidine--tRNA ligase n=1 Tax=Pseudooceanicola sp. TaxID=1914328 RepID=UPI004059E0BF